MASINSSDPVPQFAPNNWISSRWSSFEACSGLTPIMVRPWESNDIVAAIGRSLTDRTPATAALTSSISLIVSIQNISTPPAANPPAWAAKDSIALSLVNVPRGSRSWPVGPIDPATTTVCSTASASARAFFAAASFSSWTRSATPWLSKRTDDPPKVLVRMTWEPASI